MISRDLIQALTQELHHVQETQPCYLSALVDMALLSEEQRQSIMQEQGHAVHGLLQDPALESLKPLGPVLVGQTGIAGAAQYEASFAAAEKHGSELVQAWITSVLPPAELADHLSQATYAFGGSHERYLLRYYDPRVTRVLHQHADRQWAAWLFAPVLSWWFEDATTESSIWCRIRGGARMPVTRAPALHLSDALWQALESDPLPHRLLHSLEQEAPQVFTTTCRGVRLAQVEAQLEMARDHGLSTHEDLVAFAMVGLTHSAATLAVDQRWQEALRLATAGTWSLQRSLAAFTPSQQEKGLQ